MTAGGGPEYNPVDMEHEPLREVCFATVNEVASLTLVVDRYLRARYPTTG